MNNGATFINTDSEETAEILRNLGYTEIGKQGSFFCFINNGIAAFSENIANTVEYTNTTAMVT